MEREFQTDFAHVHHFINGYEGDARTTASHLASQLGAPVDHRHTNLTDKLLPLSSRNFQMTKDYDWMQKPRHASRCEIPQLTIA